MRTRSTVNSVAVVLFGIIVVIVSIAISASLWTECLDTNSFFYCLMLHG